MTSKERARLYKIKYFEKYPLDKYPYIPKSSKKVDKSKDYRKKKAAYYAAKSAERYSLKLQRSPKWLTDSHKEEIQNYYQLAHIKSNQLKNKYVVDHIIPLKGKNISGLNVPWNLQIITSSENSIKLNKFDFTYDNLKWKKDLKNHSIKEIK